MAHELVSRGSAVARPADAGALLERAAIDAPVPRPDQVFALGLNYALHAREAGYEFSTIEGIGSIKTRFTEMNA
jgi:hypothetical protein